MTWVSLRSGTASSGIWRSDHQPAAAATSAMTMTAAAIGRGPLDDAIDHGGGAAAPRRVPHAALRVEQERARDDDAIARGEAVDDLRRGRRIASRSRRRATRTRHRRAPRRRASSRPRRESRRPGRRSPAAARSAGGRRPACPGRSSEPGLSASSRILPDWLARVELRRDRAR